MGFHPSAKLAQVTELLGICITIHEMVTTTFDIYLQAVLCEPNEISSWRGLGQKSWHPNNVVV